MKSWYTIRARGTGAEVLIYDEIGAYGITAKGFLAELGALPDGSWIIRKAFSGMTISSPAMAT